MKKTALLVVLAALSFSFVAAQERGAVEITGSGENGRVLHKDIIRQNARPGDYIMVFNGIKLNAPRYLTQIDIDYSKSHYKEITEELLDTSAGSVRALLDELVERMEEMKASGDLPELPDGETEPEEVDFAFIRGKVIEFISDMRDRQQIILIVTANENSEHFDGHYQSPPWYKEIETIPPDQTVFLLTKRINTGRNEIFCMTEDIQVTKTLIKKIIAAPPAPSVQAIPEGFEIQGSTLVKYTGTDESIVIPESLGIRRIEKEAFKGTKIKAIVIPGTVSEIGEGAFQNCQNLVSVTIPKSVSIISAHVFFGCYKLIDVTLPDSIKQIGFESFRWCNSLAGITIPSSVVDIKNFAFSNCDNLVEINVHKDNKFYSSLEGILFDKTKTVLNNYPAGKSGREYTIPDSVKTIDNGTFAGNKYVEIINIPAGVIKIIFDSTFYITKIKEFRVDPENTQYIDIGGVLFSKDKTKLLKFPTSEMITDYIVPDGTKTIGEQAFFLVRKLANITLPEGLTTIEGSAFYACRDLVNVSIPVSVKNIGRRSFYSCDNLKTVNLSRNTIIGEDAFPENTSINYID